MSALKDARRFIMMDNVLRKPGSEPPTFAKGTVQTLDALREECDVNHLLKVKAIRPWAGNSGRVSDILLRKDNPSAEEYQEEIGRLQELLESLEAENEGLRKAPPPEPAKMPLDQRILAERNVELEEENVRLRRSLRDAQEQRTAAQGRADKYAAALSIAGADGLAALKLAEDEAEVIAAAGKGEDFMDEIGRPAPPVDVNLSEPRRDEGRKPVPAISKRWQEAERERADDATEAALDLLAVPTSGPGVPIRATTKAAP